MSHEDLARALIEADRDVDAHFDDRPADRAVQPCPLRQHWVEVVLMQAGLPAAGARCRVTVPDGSTRDATLNGRGRLRVEHITEGECRVAFPDFDESDDDAGDDTGDEGELYVPGRAATVRTDAVHCFHLPTWELVEITSGADAPAHAEGPPGRAHAADDDVDDDWIVDALTVGD